MSYISLNELQEVEMCSASISINAGPSHRFLIKMDMPSIISAD